MAQVRQSEGFSGNSFGEKLDADVALGLKFAQLGEGAAQKVVGLGAGTVDGFLSFAGGFIPHGVYVRGESELFFHKAATAETPQALDDTAGKQFLARK